MAVKSMDVNADLGEQVGNDAAIMQWISSCSIACGGHTGDLDSMRSAVSLARERGLKIGAHPSYPDPANFGRVKMEISSSLLYESIKRQVRSLEEQLQTWGIPLHHIKPHGALYNEACVDEELAYLLCALIKDNFPSAKIYAPYGSKLAEVAQRIDLEVWLEGFVDRRYTEGHRLLARSKAGAVLHDWEEIRKQVEEMVFRQRVQTDQGIWIPIQVDTLCLHGDHPEAVHTARFLHRWLTENRLISTHE